jgi:hypothetical protein
MISGFLFTNALQLSSHTIHKQYAALTNVNLVSVSCALRLFQAFYEKEKAPSLRRPFCRHREYTCWQTLFPGKRYFGAFRGKVMPRPLLLILCIQSASLLLESVDGFLLAGCKPFPPRHFTPKAQVRSRRPNVVCSLEGRGTRGNLELPKDLPATFLEDGLEILRKRVLVCLHRIGVVGFVV